MKSSLLFYIIKIAMKLHYGDLNDSSSLVKIIASVRPTEIYNLGAMSHVKVNILF
jgi:GDPmannose 4,6-dehydratase